MQNSGLSGKCEGLSVKWAPTQGLDYKLQK